MIVAAAIKINDLILTMPKPARHPDILRQIGRLYAPEDRPPRSFEQEMQGFITDKGIFLNRRDAYLHAMQCGQGTPCRRRLPHDYDGDELFSEDLW